VVSDFTEVNRVFVLGNFLKAIAIVLRIFIYYEIFAIGVYAIMSWFPTPYYSSLRSFFYASSEIILRPLRKLIPPIGMVDITPLIAILVLVFIDNFIVQSLFDLAVKLR